MPQLVTSKRSVLDAALRLHAAGWWVVPQVGKRAVVLGWDRFRLTEGDLRDYLADGKLNIAVALNQSSVVDVECDSPEAEELLGSLCPDLPRTPTWQSRRGLHRLFLRPEGCPDKGKVEANGIEFRLGADGKGTLTTVPPSISPDDGTIYRWLPMRSLWECDPVPMPEALVILLK